MQQPHSLSVLRPSMAAFDWFLWAKAYWVDDLENATVFGREKNVIQAMYTSV